MKATKADKLIILLLFVLTIYSFNMKKHIGKAGKVAHVFLDGKLKYKILLNVDKEYKIPIDEDDEMTLKVKGHKLYVSESTCPLRTCIKDSPIEKEGESLICVPNKMIANIIGGEDDRFDTITK